MEEVKFVDAENFSGGKFDKITFRDIVLQQLRKIGLNANCEFRGGYWEYKEIPIRSGMASSTVTTRVYIPDTREVYSNSVEYLFDLVYPHADEKLLETWTEVEKELKDAHKHLTVEPERNDKTEKETKEYERIFKNNNIKLTFRVERRRILQKLFREICCFLKRVDYFEGQSAEDTV
jgi:hypothetical protein